MNTDRAKECRAVDDLLVALAAGELESEHAAQLRAHLEDCARCSSAFAEVLRAETLAASLKLESPQIDRYPEFLRRLAADESQSLTINSEQPLEPASDAKAGVAAVIPLFGNRVAVRNGFGRGFDLSVTSRQGREWLHLSTKSLTRVAAVAGGVSLAAGISVVALLWMLFSVGKHPSMESQNPPSVERPPMRAADDGPWIQTASTAERTLAVWREGNELQAGWMLRDQHSISERVQFSVPISLPDTGNRPLLPPRAMECAVATDGKEFIVLREIEGGIYLWRIEAQTVAQPILLSRKGAQPRAAWIVDRYMVVWVAPDPHSPVIQMLEVGRDGRPLQTSATLVAQTAQGGKVGLPGVTGDNGKVLVSYFVQGGALMARAFAKTAAGYTESEAIEISGGEGPHHRPIQLLPVADGFLACWDVMNHEGAEIRLARLDASGRPRTVKTLARARTPITSFDLKILADGQLTLLWSEVQPGGALTFRQPFSLDGAPMDQPRNLFVADDKPSAVVFGDAEGKTLLWPGWNQYRR